MRSVEESRDKSLLRLRLRGVESEEVAQRESPSGLRRMLAEAFEMFPETTRDLL